MKLILGNCLERMNEIESGTVDLILTDPPYGTTQCKWDSVIDLDEMWKQLERVIKPNGAIILTACQPFTSILACSNLKNFRYDLVYDKPAVTGHLNAKKMPMRAHESILVFYKSLPTYNPQMTHGHERKTANNVNRGRDLSDVYGKELGVTNYDSTSRYPRSIQRFSSDKQRSRLHPTQKPLALMEWLVNTYSNEGDTVLDFAMGSGTTGVAAKNLSRNFIGIELDKNYFKIAEERIYKCKN